MAGDDQPTNGYSLLAALDRLREQLGDDLDRRLGEHERRMTAQVAAVEQKLTAFVIDHGKVHEEAAADQRNAAKRFDDFIQTARLERAKAQGIVAVFLFASTVLSRHWQFLVAAVVGVLVILGSVRLSVGTP